MPAALQAAALPSFRRELMHSRSLRPWEGHLLMAHTSTSSSHPPQAATSSLHSVFTVGHRSVKRAAIRHQGLAADLSSKIHVSSEGPSIIAC